jgi:hypothetical protein
MNAIDDGVSDFDLYVKAGSADDERLRLRALRPNQYGVLRVLHTRAAARGTYW